jgi:hypothetical protein
MNRHTPCALLAFCFAIALALPAEAQPAVEGGGAVRDVRGFDTVEISIVGEVILTQGSTESLEITATADDLARISTVVRQGTLYISRMWPDDNPRGPITFRLSMKTISGLRTTSACRIRSDAITTDSLRISIQSSGSVEVKRLIARTLDVEMNSSGDCSLAGSVDRQSVLINSSGEYLAADLASREATLKLNSSGRATIQVADTLSASLSSSGDVRYHGSPAKVTSTAASSGRVVKLD